jgi:hypothetical protein
MGRTSAVGFVENPVEGMGISWGRCHVWRLGIAKSNLIKGKLYSSIRSRTAEFEVSNHIIRRPSGVIGAWRATDPRTSCSARLIRLFRPGILLAALRM